MQRSATLALVGAAMGLAAAYAQGVPGQPERPAPATAPGEFQSAEALLDALETADRDLTSLVADVKYDKTFLLEGDRQIRLGKLWYVADKPADAVPVRRFAVKFSRIFIGKTRRDEDKTYVFDGQWLAEKDGEAKFCQRKQIVGPGEHFDPLKIGQGPFVMPIGQRKGDILKRYTVELLPAGAGLEPAADASEDEKSASKQAAGDAEGCWQLKLTPRPEFVAEDDFQEIRLWYKRGAKGTLLPRMARTVNEGSISIVLLTNVELQLAGQAENPAAKVQPEILNTDRPEGWDGSSTAWRKPGAAEAKEGSEGSK